MQPIDKNAGIHCKVCCNDQFVRFLFIGTEFSSLFSQVQQSLALNKAFVLQYKDNEGDLITFSSDKELAYAISYSEGNILRLYAITIDDKANETSTTDSDGPVTWRSEMVKTKLVSKRDFFKSLLDELEKVPHKTPELQRQLLRLQKKLKKIERRIEGWDEKDMGGKSAMKAEKKKKKLEKKKQKGEKKENTRNLSEETMAQIVMLMSQIYLIKPELKEVKDQINAKKAALKEVKAMGGDPRQLRQEISKLKEIRNRQKSQIRPLKEKIRELKTSC